MEHLIEHMEHLIEHVEHPIEHIEHHRTNRTSWNIEGQPDYTTGAIGDVVQMKIE